MIGEGRDGGNFLSNFIHVGLHPFYQIFFSEIFELEINGFSWLDRSRVQKLHIIQISYFLLTRSMAARDLRTIPIDIDNWEYSVDSRIEIAFSI